MRVLRQGPLPQRAGLAILVVFCGYFLAHVATGLAMFSVKMGFTYEGVVRYYLGDPERFLNPRSFAGLLEVTHFHLFAYGFFFVVFSHLLLFTRLPTGGQNLLIGALAGSLTADLMAGWLVRYLHPAFAWLKLGSFWSMQLVSVVLLMGLLWELLSRAGKTGNAIREPTDSKVFDHGAQHAGL